MVTAAESTVKDWIKRKERWRAERLRREHAQRVKLWAIESEIHAEDCACWDCVLELMSEVAKHQAEMLVRGASRRRPLVPR